MNFVAARVTLFTGKGEVLKFTAGVLLWVLWCNCHRLTFCSTRFLLHTLLASEVVHGHKCQCQAQMVLLNLRAMEAVIIKTNTENLHTKANRIWLVSRSCPWWLSLWVISAQYCCQYAGCLLVMKATAVVNRYYRMIVLVYFYTIWQNQYCNCLQWSPFLCVFVLFDRQTFWY